MSLEKPLLDNVSAFSLYFLRGLEILFVALLLTLFVASVRAMYFPSPEDLSPDPAILRFGFFRVPSIGREERESPIPFGVFLVASIGKRERESSKEADTVKEERLRRGGGSSYLGCEAVQGRRESLNSRLFSLSLGSMGLESHSMVSLQSCLGL
ncbi:hypothetical protein B0H11DRAFT_1928622 [Mycena galericulata]|nr:hypothetical protein B0H11DRAFT_1928622 [Mycena galericulata]